jgi:DNA adenine methylase
VEEQEGRQAVRPPVPSYGGKARLASWLASLLPPHATYVEVFGGSAALLFAKDPAPVEVYNDIDSNIVNLYRVLRDPEGSRRLLQALHLTPFSREEFEACRRGLADPGADDVERARRFFVVLRQSVSAYGMRWRYSVCDGRVKNDARAFRNAVDDLWLAHLRLRDVYIENADFREVLRRYDGPRTLFYLDPPYDGTVSDQPYASMADGDREEMVEMLLGLEGMAVLSGYPSPAYRRLECAGWRRLEVPVRTTARVNRNGRRSRRTEAVWLNYRFFKRSPVTNK